MSQLVTYPIQTATFKVSDAEYDLVNQMKIKKINLVNNTNTTVLANYHDEIVASIKAKGVLPDELADLFALTLVETEDNQYWILNAT